MKWLWNSFVSVKGATAKIVALGTMVLAFIIAGNGLSKLVTHERVEGEVVSVDPLCSIKCDKLTQTVSHKQTTAPTCAAIEQIIADKGLEDCRPRMGQMYSVRVVGADGTAITERLPSHKFNSDHAVGDTVAMLRDPDDPSAVEPPVSWVVYAALAYGLLLLGLHIALPWIRARKRRSA